MHFRTDNALGYEDTVLSAYRRSESLGDVDPFLLAAQGPVVAARIVEQMTPAQAARLLQRIEESGLGEDAELSGLFDSLKKIAGKVVKGVGKVASVAAPVLTAASAAFPLLAPVAGAVNVAAGVAQALSPQQVAALQASGQLPPGYQVQTFQPAASTMPEWLLPVALLGGLMLLARR